MILQELVRYYDRLADDPDAVLPALGYSSQTICFAVVLNAKGEAVNTISLMREENGRQVPGTLVVPEPPSSKSGTKKVACFAWDNTGYALGLATPKDKSAKDMAEEARISRGLTECSEKFKVFRELQHAVGDDVDDEGMKALLAFVDSWQPLIAPQLPNWASMDGQKIVFMLEGENRFLHQRPKVREAWLRHCQSKVAEFEGMCLVTGEAGPISRIHPKLKGVAGAQSTGATLVSFNIESSESYGKTQNYNSPIGEASAFKYTTALNYLLDRGNRRKSRIGDVTMVFWTERASPFEDFFGNLVDPSGEQEADVAQVREFFEGVRAGRFPSQIDPEVGFCILGLSPNVSRLSVRLWLTGSVGSIAKCLCSHFDDLSIVRRFDSDPEFPTLGQLLRETAAQKKYDNIPPLLEGQMLRAILGGGNYPLTLMTSLIVRIRADHEVNYLRAAMIKAWITRRRRLSALEHTEVGMALDSNSVDVGYRLGRLFAVLEKAQADAINSANATIRDRFFASASATPQAVFPQLLRLAQHHIAKSDFGTRLDKLIEQVSADIPSFPAHLSLEEQGLFMLGYYHQRQDLWKAKSDKKEEEK